MFEKIPTAEQMIDLIGLPLYEIWKKLCALVDEQYEMEHLWDSGGKAWTYEYKYRRSGKTLCALYAKENCIGFMLVLGKDERAKFENDRENFSTEIQTVYDNAQTYHDGKWIMFKPTDTSLFDDLIKLLALKRTPNKTR